MYVEAGKIALMRVSEKQRWVAKKKKETAKTAIN
jgi:hypothetical protein